MISSLWQKLKDKLYRKHFVDAQLKRGVPFQIRAMRKKLGMSQQELAIASGLTQGVISRAENPNYGNLTFNTVLEIASGFDVAFVGAFVPFTKLEEWYRNLSAESVSVKTFAEEDRDDGDLAQPQSRTTRATFRMIKSGNTPRPVQITLPLNGPTLVENKPNSNAQTSDVAIAINQ